ncbi:MAG TPA: hypothetical protein VIH47_03565, partial [Solirubrobacterales bacterium]
MLSWINRSISWIPTGLAHPGIGISPSADPASLAQLAALHEEHGHLQEVILQNFVPHQSYYGREPPDIADAAAQEYWRTGVGHGPQLDAPKW